MATTGTVLPRAIAALISVAVAGCYASHGGPVDGEADSEGRVDGEDGVEGDGENVEDEARHDTADGESDMPDDMPVDDLPPRCGDGLLDDDEECDDGNEVQGDGCDSDCRYSCHGDLDCIDDLECSHDECVTVPAGRACRNLPLAGWCVIDAVCRRSGEADPAGPCRSCDPDRDTSRWSPRPAGTACDNRLYCDGAPDACDGAGACLGGSPPCAEGPCGGCDEDLDVCSLVPTGVVCRAAVNECDTVETCDGTSVGCPEDSFEPAGVACDDGDACTAPDSCDGSGHCVGDTSATVPPSPLPLWPPNGGLTGSVHALASFATLRPELRWRWLSDGCSPPSYRVQVDDSCPVSGFQACEFPSPEAEASDLADTRWRPPTELAVRDVPPVGRRYFWRVAACRGVSCSSWSPIRYLDVGRVIVDLDGDGYSDVAVGAPAFTTVAVHDGSVFVFAGSATGVRTDAPSPLGNPSPADGAYFGEALAAGDVNADGFSDLIVGAYRQDIIGAIFVFHGSPAGIDPAPNLRIDSPRRDPEGQFGGTVAAGQDVDADGFADVVVGARSLDWVRLNQGAVFVFRGTPTGVESSPAATLTVPSSYDDTSFGRSLDFSGDVNADGFADLLVGARHRAYVYTGRTSGIASLPTTTLADPTPSLGLDFATAVAVAGDLDADGFSDVLVGAPFDYDHPGGAVYVFGGGETGIPTVPDVAISVPPGTRGALFGGAICSAGDTDHDGFADVVAAAYQDDAAYLYRGSAAGLPSSPSQTFRGSGNFGWACAGAGDVNGDGYDDVIVGAPYDDVVVVEGGSALVFCGLPGGLDPSPCAVLSAEQPRAHFGSSVR